MLLNKYKPNKLNEIHGQDAALIRLRKAIFEKKPALIYGLPGIGKSASVYAFAHEYDYDVLEVNASDYRNKDNIENIIGNYSRQGSLFARKKLIFIDEIDGLNIKDRGAVSEIISVIKKSSYPIVIVGNEIWDSKFKDLRKVCEIIEFIKLDNLSLLKLLREIIVREGANVDGSLLQKIVINSKGDVRSAINDLELLIISSDEIDLRDKDEQLSNLLKFIFKSKDKDKILKSFDSINENFDDMSLWLEENIPNEYSGNDLKKAYDFLSKSDVYKGRIFRWQHWRFMVYQRLFMGLGIAFSKDKINSKYVRYTRNTRILKMWIYKNKNASKKELADKLSKDLHISSKRLMNEINYMRFLHSF